MICFWLHACCEVKLRRLLTFGRRFLCARLLSGVWFLRCVFCRRRGAVPGLTLARFNDTAFLVRTFHIGVVVCVGVAALLLNLAPPEGWDIAGNSRF